MSGNSEVTTGTDAWIFGHETGPAWHVRVSTMRRQITLKILRQIIFEMEVLAFIDAAGAKSVIMTDRIIGCPHEAGVDYDEGQSCSRCPFRARREPLDGQPHTLTKRSAVITGKKSCRLVLGGGRSAPAIGAEEQIAKCTPQ